MTFDYLITNLFTHNEELKVYETDFYSKGGQIVHRLLNFKAPKPLDYPTLHTVSAGGTSQGCPSGYTESSLALSSHKALINYENTKWDSYEEYSRTAKKFFIPDNCRNVFMIREKDAESLGLDPVIRLLNVKEIT